jgi:hypothetical protein
MSDESSLDTDGQTVIADLDKCGNGLYEHTGHKQWNVTPTAYFTLDGDGKPVPCDAATWRAWSYEARDTGQHADTLIGIWFKAATRSILCGADLVSDSPRVWVLTSFTGLGYADGKPPLLFETMLYHSDRVVDNWYTTTRGEAQAVHTCAVELSLVMRMGGAL